MVLEWEDWVVIGVYFVVILGTGLGVSFFTKKSSGNATDFLLAGRSMWFLPVAFSLFSSNIGSSHFIGLAGTGASGDSMIINYFISKKHHEFTKLYKK